MTPSLNSVVFSVSLACWTLASFVLSDTGFAQEELTKQIAEGRLLFTHKWTVNDPLSPAGDGLGPAFNEVSCVACHFQGGIGGAGVNEKNADMLSIGTIDTPDLALRDRVRQKINEIHPLLDGNSTTMLHRFNTNATYEAWRTQRLEMKAEAADSRTAMKRAMSGRRDPKFENIQVYDIPVRFVQRNTPALFGAALIDAISDEVIREEAAFQSSNNLGVKGRVPRANPSSRTSKEVRDGSPLAIGRFGWRGQTSSLREFVFGACSNELGLEVPDNPQASDPLRIDYRAPGFDLSLAQCDQLVAFVASLPRPQQILPDSEELAAEVQYGERVFNKLLCANCHARQLGDVDGLYSDLLLHDMGPALADPIPPNPEKTSSVSMTVMISPSFRTYYGGLSELFSQVPPKLQQEWRTPPLWGVRDSAPYLHDGRAQTLEEAIALHGGEAQFSLRAYQKASGEDRERLILFLKTLAAPDVSK